MKLVLLMLLCSSSAYANGSIDEAIKAMKEQMMEQTKVQMDMLEAKQERQMAQFKDEMIKKDETIAALTSALKAKTEHRQVQLTAGGEVMQLVSEADFKELTARVAACEKTNADQDAKLGMTMDTLTKARKEFKGGRVAAPPALPPSPPPPLPPPRPIAKPGRQLQSQNFVNELSVTGPNAVVSWNSHTPGLTSFNCTGVGDGKLVCSGALQAPDFTTADGSSIIARLDTLETTLEAFANRTTSLQIFSFPSAWTAASRLATAIPIASCSSSSGHYSNELSDNTCDGDPSTVWHSDCSLPAFVVYDLGPGHSGFNMVSIQASVYDDYLNDWMLQSSDDAATWSDIFARTGDTPPQGWGLVPQQQYCYEPDCRSGPFKNYALDEVGTSRYYRILVTQTTSGRANRDCVQWGDVQFLLLSA